MRLKFFSKKLETKIEISDLSFSSSGGDINISYGNDLLAVVQNTTEADLNFI